ncbi:MAG: oligopeptide transporter, OPT family, partial [Ignavibacteria bacterium]
MPESPVGLHEVSPSQVSPALQHFKPYVPPDQSPAEATFRALVLGSVLGIIFGAASVYLGLRVGLTTSASIPIAVMSITILKKLGKSTILENNIVQTVGSAGESIAAAVVFTIPALIFLGYALSGSLTLLIALTGGVLGVLMMIPLRRYLIVKEHGNLRFPEGTACAEILKAGETGGTWKPTPARDLSWYPGSSIGMDVSPELMGVGYIIGWQTSVIMVAGGLLSSFILGPLIAFAGKSAGEALYPATKLIRDMSPYEIWRFYIKYIGAGAVATGGVLGLFRAFPAIWDSLRASFRQFAVERFGSTDHGLIERTERDTPITVVAFGSIALVIFIWL